MLLPLMLPPGRSQKLYQRAQSDDDHSQQQWVSCQQFHIHVLAEDGQASGCGGAADDGRGDNDDRPDEFQCQGTDDEACDHGQEELDVSCKWQDGCGGHERKSEAQKKDAGLVDPVGKD